MEKNNVSLIGDHISGNFEPYILSTVLDKPHKFGTVWRCVWKKGPSDIWKRSPANWFQFDIKLNAQKMAVLFLFTRYQ